MFKNLNTKVKEAQNKQKFVNKVNQQYEEAKEQIQAMNKDAEKEQDHKKITDHANFMKVNALALSFDTESTTKMYCYGVINLQQYIARIDDIVETYEKMKHNSKNK